MNKEAQEKIKRGLPKNPYPNQYVTDIGLTTYQIDKGVEAGRIAYMEAQQDMLRAGYRKLPKDKPPLLSSEEITDAQIKYIEAYKKENNVTLNFPLAGWLREDCIKQAQREADIKFHEEIWD